MFELQKTGYIEVASQVGIPRILPVLLSSSRSVPMYADYSVGHSVWRKQGLTVARASLRLELLNVSGTGRRLQFRRFAAK